MFCFLKKKINMADESLQDPSDKNYVCVKESVCVCVSSGCNYICTLQEIQNTYMNCWLPGMKSWWLTSVLEREERSGLHTHTEKKLRPSYTRLP